MWRWISAALIVGACSPGNLISAYQLRDVDALSTDAQALRVAVEVPEAFRPLAESVEMIGTLTVGDTPTEEMRVSLVPTSIGALEQNLKNELEAGDDLYIYEIKKADIATFDRFRKRVQLVEDSGVDAAGALTVSTPVCRDTPGIPNQILVTVHLKAAEVDDYVTLVRNRDMMGDVDLQNIETLAPPC